MRIQSSGSFWTSRLSPAVCAARTDLLCQRARVVLCNNPPTSIHTTSQAPKTLQTQPLALQNKYSRENQTINSDALHSQLFICNCSKCHRRAARFRTFRIYSRLPISMATALVPATTFSHLGSAAVSELVSLLRLSPPRGMS